jgi:putative N-acetylmannosamine-6-phosphate epimerase
MSMLRRITVLIGTSQPEKLPFFGIAKSDLTNCDFACDPSLNEVTRSIQSYDLDHDLDKIETK